MPSIYYGRALANIVKQRRDEMQREREKRDDYPDNVNVAEREALRDLLKPEVQQQLEEIED